MGPDSEATLDCNEDVSPMTVRPIDISPPVLVVSPPGQFALWLYATKTFRHQDRSPLRIYYLNDITKHTQQIKPVVVKTVD